ncbi:MAG TPA: rhomboid family intramembrane serine protease [Anaerohalosphaeraceae bacterium]|nr:rhomboid family intramembrane serine protease [Phycisphaerae bacterium]HOK95600.1 rhomboid family intramembrane serine protease [Anaerohalosphaeraceae bacterium]HOL30925.1 rhomboid family intramembrane serine protease [Anaerohalosphaeraceae bacterium]HOM76278.1 rhomboid family intramembrane serine protease [Anaerohalosphaeraceae bacterium]HPC65132.1 rhomboid family intramembrane serine protease [Anaerohalosphaeraceae bacterium]
MLLIPYAVDVPFDRRPFVNWLLTASIAAAFVWQVADKGQTVEQFALNGWTLKGLFGHLWLHADILHLIGNMIFLWVFGNAVCAKLGNLLYLPVYLLFGLAAATAHRFFDGSPAIGASGAINGVVGMFLVLFWQNEMDCLFVMFIFFRPIVKTFSISSFWMIGLWLVFDILGAIVGGSNTAYFAHLGGFFMGIVLAVLLLKCNLVTMYSDEQSLVELVEQWRQKLQDDKLERIARVSVNKAQKQDTAPPVPAMIRFVCPCGKQIKAPIQAAGKTGLCPVCRRKLIVPHPTAEP